jgi:hypothetical protein
MSGQKLESKIADAETMRGLPDGPDYFEGYMWGLRQFYHRTRVDTLQEHKEWLSLARDRDKTKADCGRGYLDGLRGIGSYV